MDIKPIRTRADYRASLKEIEKLMGAKANTPEGEKLDIRKRSTNRVRTRVIHVLCSWGC